MSIRMSLEFYPPRSDAGQRRFWHTLGWLETLKPSYISMTWGALGSDKQASIDILKNLCNDCQTPVTAHLSCAGQSLAQMSQTITELEALAITRFLALRGDSVQCGSVAGQGSDSLQHASDLVALLAQDPGNDISVAAYPEKHPESPDVQSDLHWLRNKVDAGARRAVTQFFFDPDTFLRFRDNALSAGIKVPLVPGILPIHNIQKVQEFGAKCGASVPAETVRRFASATTRESFQAASVEQCVSLCERLLREGVEEFHFYTLNQAPLVYAVGRELLSGQSGTHAGDVAAA